MNIHQKRFLCMSLLAVLFLMTGGFDEVKAQGSEIFVSVDGSGTACSQAMPCHFTQGLANAVHGDTIFFKGGNYTGSTDPIIEVTQGILLIGGWDGVAMGGLNIDPQAFPTVIDGEGVRGIIEINLADDTRQVNIEGFTLQNGYADYGGAINIKDGRVEIEDNIIQNNASNNYGGGIYGNAKDGLEIINNLLSGNTAVWGGGGIHINRSLNPEKAIIESNLFSANSTGASGYGGAIEISRSSALINANIIANTFNTSSSILITAEELVEVTNNLIYWDSYNSANPDAIKDYYEEGEVTQVINNTIINAHTAIEDAYKAKINVTNNIIYGCWKSIDNEGNVTGSRNLFFDNTDDPFTLTNPVTGLDPLFVDPANQDYHIQSSSPAKDGGASVPLTIDFEEDIRPLGIGYDIGADEYNYTPIFTSSPLTQAKEGEVYQYTITVSDPDVATGDVLVFSATTKPPWLTLTKTGPEIATLSGTPPTGDAGHHTIILNVSDLSGAFDEQSFTILVEPEDEVFYSYLSIFSK